VVVVVVAVTAVAAVAGKTLSNECPGLGVGAFELSALPCVTREIFVMCDVSFRASGFTRLGFPFRRSRVGEPLTGRVVMVFERGLRDVSG
jgi:hypothetical protein